MPSLQLVRVSDEQTGAETGVEIGDCGKGFVRDAAGRIHNKCGHRHVDPFRFESALDTYQGVSPPEIGITVENGRNPEVQPGPATAGKDKQGGAVLHGPRSSRTRRRGLYEREGTAHAVQGPDPAGQSADPANDVIRYEIYDQVGQMDDINPASDDIPTADVLYERQDVLRSLGSHLR